MRGHGARPGVCSPKQRSLTVPLVGIPSRWAKSRVSAGVFSSWTLGGGLGGREGGGRNHSGLRRFRRHPHCWRHRSDLRFSLTSSLALIPRSSLYYAGPTPITRNDVPISRSSAQSPLQSPFGHTHLHRSWRLECDISGGHHSANPGDQPKVHEVASGG